jgi:hypothetical protein
MANLSEQDGTVKSELLRRVSPTTRYMVLSSVTGQFLSVSKFILGPFVVPRELLLLAVFDAQQQHTSKAPPLIRHTGHSGKIYGSSLEGGPRGVIQASSCLYAPPIFGGWLLFGRWARAIDSRGCPVLIITTSQPGHVCNGMAKVGVFRIGRSTAV